MLFLVVILKKESSRAMTLHDFAVGFQNLMNFIGEKHEINIIPDQNRCKGK